MKLSLNQEKLNRALNIAGKIITPRSSLPILNNILFSTDNGRLKITSTDLEIAINSWVGAKIEQDGKITIPARLLIDFIANNDDEKINLNLKENQLELSSKKYQAHIKTLDANEYPLIPEIKSTKLLTISNKELQEAIKKTIFACSLDETRPILTGVFFKVEDNILKIAATDSYRLAETTLKLGEKTEKNINIIIPFRTMTELNRILSTTANENVDIFVEENQIMFNFSDIQITSRLIEGNFPDYKQIIPKEYKSKIIINTQNFAKVVRMASFFARESANNIRLKFNQNQLLITAISPQLGDNLSTIEINKEGEDLEIVFNAKFILDILNVIEEENILIESSGKLNPAVIKPEKNNKFLYIAMPLRVEE